MTRTTRRRRTGWIGFTVAIAVGVGTAIGIRAMRDGDGPGGPVPAARPVAAEEVLRPGSAAGFDVLLVTFDTTRRDRIGCYGAGPGRTVALDGLAAAGLRVDDAVTSAPVTLPSHATLLTGLYPPHHGARDNGLYVLDGDVPTLAATLRDAGWDTAAFVGAFVLDARFGLDRGFDTYDFRPTKDGVRPRMPDFNERDARAVTDAAVGWLQARDAAAAAGGPPRPYFLWVHYFDPHLPYHPPLAVATDPALGGDPYAAEIAWADVQLGRLLDVIRGRGTLDRTLVVATADHGESLGEHGEDTHGLFLYGATTRVPLILAAPAAFGGPLLVADRVVGLVDVRPTIEDLLGLPRTEPCDGRSLLEPADDARAIYLETEAPRNQSGWSPLAAMRTRDTQYVEAPRPELYDIAADPGETVNLLEAGGSVAEAARARAAALRAPLLAIFGDADPAASRRTLDPEERERLMALGYVRGEVADPAAPGGALPDPKDMLPLFAKSLRAEELSSAGEWEQAVEMAREVVHECPLCSRSVRVLAFGLRRLGEPDEAVRVLRDATDARDDPYLQRALAQVLILEERWSPARAALDRYEAMSPDDGRVPMLRGDILARQGDREGAIAAWREAIALDPNRVGLLAKQRIEQMETEG